MKTTSIRNAVLSDLPYLYEICLKTGADGKDARAEFSDPWFLGQYYAAPYLVYNARFCFVVENNHIPAGYLVGTDNTTQFNQWFEKIWLPPLRSRYPEEAGRDTASTSAREISMIAQLHRPVFTPVPDTSPWIVDYPAHFHINLLPEVQGQGFGTELIAEFIRQLHSDECPGTHLGVSINNTGAIAFYRKVGFTVLSEDRYGKIMGKRC